MKLPGNMFSKSLRDKSLSPESIPPSIRSLILLEDGASKSSALTSRTDIFRNNKTKEMSYQLFSNVRKLFYLDGFEISKTGTYMMDKPILKEMTTENYNSISGMDKICILRQYDEIKFLSTIKDDFKTNGSIFLLTEPTKPSVVPLRRMPINMAKKGRVSMFEHKIHSGKHGHEYSVDEFGNGWTTLAIHPKNSKIRHRHKIVNWVVQEAKSDCYPKCKEMYNSHGAPPHIHKIENSRAVSKEERKKQISKQIIDSLNFNEHSPSDVGTSLQGVGTIGGIPGQSLQGVGTIGGMPGQNLQGVGTIGGIPGVSSGGSGGGMGGTGGSSGGY
jgi:hypothetical protein